MVYEKVFWSQSLETRVLILTLFLIVWYYDAHLMIRYTYSLHIWSLSQRIWFLIWALPLVSLVKLHSSVSVYFLIYKNIHEFVYLCINLHLLCINLDIGGKKEMDRISSFNQLLSGWWERIPTLTPQDEVNDDVDMHRILWESWLYSWSFLESLLQLDVISKIWWGCTSRHQCVAITSLISIFLVLGKLEYLQDLNILVLLFWYIVLNGQAVVPYDNIFPLNINSLHF